MKIVVIGLGTAGFSSILYAKKENLRSEITVVEKRNYDTYSPCGIPYALEGKISFDELKHSFPAEKMGVRKLNGFVARKVDTEEREVIVASDGREEVLEYDSLILATGARSALPPVRGIEDFLRRGVYTVRSIEDGEEIYREAKNASRVVVIGAGLIGLEMANAFSQLGLKTDVVEIFDQVLPKSLDRDMARDVQRYLENLGVVFHLGEKVVEMRGDDRIREVILESDVIETDLAIVSAGVKANTELAENAGIEVGKYGIKTDRRMRTSVEDVYAAGDCASNIRRMTGEEINIQLASVAYRQGMVAGINASGGDAEYPGDSDTSISLIGDLEVGFVGLTEAESRERGYSVVVSKGKAETSEYLSEGNVKVKLVFERNGRLLGAQITGRRVREKLAPLSMAVHATLDARMLFESDFGYSPLQAEYYDLINRLAENALKKMRRAQ